MGDILKLLTGNLQGVVKGKTRQALQGAVNALPPSEIEHLAGKYSRSAVNGALKGLVPALKRARQQGGSLGLNGVRNMWRKKKAALNRYSPKNVIRRGVRGATNAAIEGVLDSVIPRMEAMQTGSGFWETAGKTARKTGRGAEWILKNRGRIEKGLNVAKMVGMMAGNQNGGRLTGTRRANNLLALPWEMKGVNPTMSGAVLSRALNRLSTDDRATAIELIKRGYKY